MLNLKTKKFTLIELLVVVAIIGLLVTMLMPSLNQAREKAKETVCLSNEKQLYIAFANHCSQNNDTYPVTGGGYSWDDILSDYLDLNWPDSQKTAFSITDKSLSTDILKCPSDEVSPANNSQLRRSYAVNQYKPKTTVNSAWFNKALPGIISVSKDYENQSIKSSQVNSPSVTVLLSEQWRNWNIAGAMSAQLNGYGLMKLAYDPTSAYWQHYQCHGNGRANVLMTDGSAQMRQAQSLLEGSYNENTNDYRGSWLDYLH